MPQDAVTVEEVRDAQESFKTGFTSHEEKKFREAIEAFKSVASIHPFDENHLQKLEKNLKQGNFKLQQESLAYMGCAAEHLNQLLQKLDKDLWRQVPVDEQLSKIFKDWE